MAEAVICDTNAVIQLVIICPDIFGPSGKALNLVVHTIVKQEIHQLRKDPEKERLKDVLEFILKNISTNSSQKFPNRQKEEQSHYMILKVERGLPPGLVPTGSSPNDRKFLMLARENSATLLTNETTLYNLGKAILKTNTWRVGDVIEKVKELKIISDNELQDGINKLAPLKETLSEACARKIRALGFKY